MQILKKVALLGAGGNCIDIFEELCKQDKYEIVGYINSNEDKFLKKNIDLKYLGNEDCIQSISIDSLIITFAGLGKNIKDRKEVFNKYKAKCSSLIFGNSSISKFAKISDKGVLIFGSALVKSFCILEENVFINAGTIIGHHVTIKKNTVISLGVLIGGRVVIEEEVFIGMGAKIFQNVKIGKGSIIGAGVIVRKNVPPFSRVL